MKKWYQSKTMWFNIIAGAVAIGSYATDNIPNPKVQAIAGTVVAIGNLVLRAGTSTGIGTDSTPPTPNPAAPKDAQIQNS